MNYLNYFCLVHFRNNSKICVVQCALCAVTGSVPNKIGYWRNVIYSISLCIVHQVSNNQQKLNLLINLSKSGFKLYRHCYRTELFYFNYLSLLGPRTHLYFLFSAATKKKAFACSFCALYFALFFTVLENHFFTFLHGC